ncbi:hypothetical protein CDAR_558181 [Caerostris darwini]|uniref:Uncharacterized protein n=1 Tax=Caerostris darwini TaxID=1538125 RepID=A0AAV4R965_9ARAC|nr:hypothetical protein CDAR_558181 [Caerostris darwini]
MAPPDRARFIRNKSSSGVGVTGCAERISFSCQTETFSFSYAFLLTPFQGPPPLHLFLSFSNTNWRKTHCRLADTQKRRRKKEKSNVRIILGKRNGFVPGKIERFL